MVEAIGSHFFPEIAAGGFSRVDGSVQFWQRINALIRPDAVVLDFGAGRGASQLEDVSPYRRNLMTLKGRVRELIGADVDPAVMSNPSLDRAVMIGADGRLPLSDASIDVIVSDYTFEHVENPDQVSRELDRVLVPGGWICVRTPNRYGYIALANRWTPDRLADKVVRRAQQTRKHEDIFPAVYRLNTSAAFTKYFPPTGYDHHVIHWDPEPAYHFGSKWLYSVTLAIHSVTPDRFKTILMVFMCKRAGA
jgi:SAM-dependent methyltransferase